MKCTIEFKGIDEHAYTLIIVLLQISLVGTLESLFEESLVLRRDQ